MPRTRRVDCSSPGIARRRHGRGFVYLGPDGARVTDHDVLARIDALAIPPAWREVWICADPRGHIQATIADALAEAVEPDPDDPVDERPVRERVRRAVLDLIAGDEDAPDVERVAA